MPENIYTKYNIDVNRLTRDYLKFPLKKIPRKSNGGLQYEELPKEDFVYLYIECNIPKKVLMQYLNVGGSYITRLGNLYNIKKSYNQRIENSKKTNLERYGVETPLQSPIIQEKSKQTCLKKFGVEHPAQSPIVLEKMKQTNLERYGVENYAQTDECQEKMKQTNLERYGVEHYSQTEECKEKIKQTCLDHFGVENPYQSPIIQEKTKQTNLERYGFENPYQSPIVQEKTKQTNLQKFGVEYFFQSNEFKELYKDEDFVKQTKQKEYETKKKNGSFGKSEEEDEIYAILLTKFKEVIRQYKSELYPFPCDFYIPEIDLYIEYQGYFTHGFEPYIGTDEQKEIVKEWKNKPQKNQQYSRAIKTWTVRDPLKRDTAKENNLNWIEFFNMKEFIKWFESI